MNRRRSIDIQPTANLFLQKGIGKMLRRRLKRCGIDLDDQSRNQLLAQQAYSAGLATIDLESASDTVSSELVRLLLPAEWYKWLDRFRTHSISLDGQSHKLAKFSAMGNGFTFELESLIFYSLCWAVVRAEANDYESPISVYGDDIIVSSVHFERVSVVLTECGFILNGDKSFSDGPFYESCGKHYFKGFDVTPPIQKEVIDSGPSSIRAANRLWRWAFRMGSGLCLDSVASQAFEVASDLVVQHHQFKHLRKAIAVPVQPWYLEGDGGLITNNDFGSDRNRIVRIPLYRAVSKRKRGIESALLHETLHVGRMSELPSYGYVTPRGDVKWTIGLRRVALVPIGSPLWC
jgi:hypothetical protein